MSVLRDLKFTKASASDGRAAITALQRDPEPYWSVLTDIIMPGADGLEVLRAAKEANPELNAVIVTGYASLDTAIEHVRGRRSEDHVLGRLDTNGARFDRLEVMLERICKRKT